MEIRKGNYPIISQGAVSSTSARRPSTVENQPESFFVLFSSPVPLSQGVEKSARGRGGDNVPWTKISLRGVVIILVVRPSGKAV